VILVPSRFTATRELPSGESGQQHDDVRHTDTSQSCADHQYSVTQAKSQQSTIEADEIIIKFLIFLDFKMFHDKFSEYLTDFYLINSAFLVYLSDENRDQCFPEGCRNCA
jgi:hypothetical protein